MRTDPTSPSTGRTLSRLLEQGALACPEIPVTSHINVSLAGAGESYAAWLVSDETTGKSVLWRFPRRAPEDMPRPMADEYAALRRVPPDWGTRGLAIDDTVDNLLGTRYLVTTYVPGSILTPQQWTLDGVLDHARRLAGLHRAEYPLAGAIDDEAGHQIDLIADFESGFSWWADHHPEVVRTTGLASLADQVHTFLQRTSHEFAENSSYSFIHGDLVATNIVTGPDDRPRYIDWEWAQIGDVAQDLAYLGGTVHGGPWYVPMSDHMIKQFVSAYHAEAVRLERAPGDVDGLIARRNAWEVFERFLSTLHFIRQRNVHGSDSAYPAAVDSLLQTLADRLHKTDGT